jgi:DNA-binding NtrC family response regulator
MSPVSFGSFPLPSQGELLVGRSATCPIRVDDPLASREHARLHVNPDQEGSGFRFHIEDLNSANGTRVRDKRIPPGKAVPLFVGEAVKVGSTVLMLQQSRPTVGAGRLWSRAYFEGLLESECARASEDDAFAVARIHMGAQTSWSRIVPVLVREVPFPHVFAAYGPRDYEILFRERSPNEVVRRMNRLIGEFQKCAIVANQAVTWYPRDGVTAKALLDRMDALLRVRPGEAAIAWPADERQPRVVPPVVVDGAASAPEVVAAVPGEPAPAAGSAAGMTRLREMARRAAARKINVLILGETGAGKEVLARTIHDFSGRRGKFVALNCASLPEQLVESELFGYEKGAFSGASSAKLGLMEAGNGGTVFLDEIGEMPERIQVRLLRALETREILPVGATRPRPIDVRFLAATNRDLELEVRNGRFRRDLFFRLNGISLTIPPLRERVTEIPELVRTFLVEASRESGDEEPPRIAPESMRRLLEHSWPGNIRELKNTVERALVLCDGPEILPEHLLPLGQLPDDPPSAPAAPSPAPAAAPEPARAAERYAAEIGAVAAAEGQEPVWLADPMKAAERTAILAALDANAWSQTRAAKALGIPRRTFVSKLAYYGIPRPQRQRQRIDEPTNG